MRLTGAAEALALHGAAVAPGPSPVIRLGDEDAGAADVVSRGTPGDAEPGVRTIAPGGAADVVWRATPGDAEPGVRTIAPGGAGLWRRAPLPAADALFELPPPPAAAAVLVAGGDAELRGAAARKLSDAGVRAREAAVVTPAALVESGVVVIVGAPGAPLTSLAPAAMAAGRLLVAPRADPAFGFAPGVDHLVHRDEEELARVALAAARHPAAFAPVAALGRIAAEAHRASIVLARIAADLG